MMLNGNIRLGKQYKQQIKFVFICVLHVTCAIQFICTTYFSNVIIRFLGKKIDTKEVPNQLKNFLALYLHGHQIPTVTMGTICYYVYSFEI